MKIKIFILSLVAAFTLSSCNFGYRYKAEDLALPILKALQHNNVDRAIDLLPLRKDINSLTYGNPALLGMQYYNKYSQTYNYKNLVAKMTSDFSTAQYLTKANNLEWKDVQVGSITPEEVNADGAGYTRVTVDLKFPGGNWIMAYNAIKSQSNGWFLANDVYLAKKK